MTVFSMVISRMLAVDWHNPYIMLRNSLLTEGKIRHISVLE